MPETVPTQDDLMRLLADVEDPEIPVLNVVEMGIVRAAEVRDDGTLEVAITPTYSGCPAMREIENEIVRVMQGHGFAEVEVRTVFDEPWTTDWMTDEAREKLRGYGIAPPEQDTDDEDDWTLPVLNDPNPVACPFCGSSNTKLTSAFGSTACKALRYCNACEQPFEHFKCI